MAYTPVATNREANANGGRIYGANRFYEIDRNNWGLLDDLWKQRPGRAYRLEIPGQPGWIEYTPVGTSAGDIDRALRRDQISRHFGPLLNLADAPDDIVYQVTASENARRLANGDVELAVVSGMSLGICFNDVRDIATHDRGTVSLNLRQRKIDAAERGEDFINLDPTIELTSGDWGRLFAASVTSWADLREIDDFQGADTASFTVASWNGVTFWIANRIATVWNSGVGAVASATFNGTASVGDVTDIHVSRMKGANTPLLPFGGVNASNFGKVLDAGRESGDGDNPDSTPIGFLNGSGDIAIPNTEWADPLYLGFLERGDQTNTEPGAGVNDIRTLVIPGVTNEPFIDYSLIFGRRTAHPRTGNRGSRVT